MVVRYNDQAKRDEDIVARELRKHWNVTVERTVPFSDFDFILKQDGHVVGWVETKARTHKYGTYPTIYLSLSKFKKLIQMSRLTGIKAYFVVKYEDGTYWLRITADLQRLYNVITAGRKDRTNAPHDIEQMLDIPIKRLRRLDADNPLRGRNGAGGDSSRSERSVTST